MFGLRIRMKERLRKEVDEDTYAKIFKLAGHAFIEHGIRNYEANKPLDILIYAGSPEDIDDVLSKIVVVTE